MQVPGRASTDKPSIYEEVGMLWTPNNILEGIGHWDSSVNITSLAMDYDAGIIPQLVVEAIFERIEAYKTIQPSVWIHLQPLGEVMRAANSLLTRWPDPNDRPPLWGIPFSVKDSIDVAGIPTTGGCPPLASTPTMSAPIYQKCLDAGALFIGKTNMEQLATGMTGCRSAYGTLHSTFSKDHSVGGSSSGSAVTVSEGLVSFSLGSDTAGSIRVPALFNGIVGFKPTKGTVSARGVKPASLHQDCVSFLSNTIEESKVVWDVCKGFDTGDLFAKLPARYPSTLPAIRSDQIGFGFGIPPPAALDTCSSAYKERFLEVIETLQGQGGRLIEMDWKPFEEANKLLYEGSFVLERLTILPDGWFDKNKQLLHPVTRQVFEGALAKKTTAVDVFKDLHKQAGYKRAVEDVLTFDDETGVLTVMVVPTTPFHPTIKEIEADPLGINAKLGAFAHFANVLDLTCVAMPCGTYESEGDPGVKTRLPFGVTVLAGAGLDGELLGLAARIEDALRHVGEDD